MLLNKNKIYYFLWVIFCIVLVFFLLFLSKKDAICFPDNCIEFKGKKMFLEDFNVSIKEKDLHISGNIMSLEDLYANYDRARLSIVPSIIKKNATTEEYLHFLMYKSKNRSCINPVDANGDNVFGNNSINFSCFGFELKSAYSRYKENKYNMYIVDGEGKCFEVVYRSGSSMGFDEVSCDALN